MTMTSAELFAARGDEWNNPNHQFTAEGRGYRERIHPDGTIERVFGPEIEGYTQPSHGPRAAIHKPEFVEPNPGKRVDLAQARRRAAMLQRATRLMRSGPEVIRVR